MCAVDTTAIVDHRFACIQAILRLKSVCRYKKGSFVVVVERIMRNLSMDEMKSVSGGTSALSKYALPPGAPITDEMARQGFFDPTNTGNAYIDMVNTAVLVGTGELPPSALEQYQQQNPCEEAGTIYHYENVGPTENFPRFFLEILESELNPHEDHWDTFIRDEYISCMEGVMRGDGYAIPE